MMKSTQKPARGSEFITIRWRMQSWMLTQTIRQGLIWNMQILASAVKWAAVTEFRCPRRGGIYATGQHESINGVNESRSHHRPLHILRHAFQVSCGKVPRHLHRGAHVSESRCIQELLERSCLWIIKEIYGVIDCTWSAAGGVRGRQTSFLNGLLGFFPLAW